MREFGEGHPATIPRPCNPAFSARPRWSGPGGHPPRQRDSQRRFIEDDLKPLLGLPQRLLGPPIRRAFLDFLHGAAHRRSKPGKTFLEDIIGRAVLERINGPFLAQRPGHKDNGMAGQLVRAIFNADNPSNPGSKKSERIKSTPPVFERRHKVITILHQRDGARDASASRVD